MNVWTTSTASINPVQRTQTHFDGDQDAQWNEEFVLKVENAAEDYLFVEVMNHNDITSHRLIGKAKFACSDITIDAVEAWVQIYRLDGTDAGEVLLQMKIK